MFGANAPGDMRRAKGSLLYADEIDAIKRNESDEGDPLAIFKKRGDEFRDTIRAFMSYPSVRGLSNIDAMMAETLVRKQEVIDRALDVPRGAR